MAPLVTVEQFAAYPRVAAAGVPTADVLPLLEAVSDDIRDYCGWHIAPSVSEVLTANGSGGEVQGLPTLHLTAVASVTEDGAAVELADVEWSHAGYLRKRDAGRWTARLRGVTAQVTHGYAETPPGLVALVCDLALARLTIPAGVSREQSGGESISYFETGSDLNDQQRRLLDRRYRIAHQP